MRSLTLSMAFFALLKLCGGSTEQADTPPVGAAAAGAITVTAQHGGVMVSADDAWIELVTKDNGEVEAYVVDLQGQPLAHEAAQVTSVQVQGHDGQPHQVELQWDDDGRRFAGRTEVHPIAAAPAELQVVVRGQPRRARAPQIVLVAAPPLPPSVSVRASAPPRSVVVTPPPPRPGATVVFEQPTAPQATVVLQAPPPPSVVVQAPRPPGVVVTAPPPPRPGVVVVGPQPPRAGVVVTAPPPPRPGVVVVGPHPPGAGVVVEGGHPGRGRGHAYGRRGREAEVVVSPPRPGAVVVTPPSPGRIEVRGGGGGRVEVRGGRGRGR